MSPGLLTGPSVIAVLGRDVVVRLLEISRSGCLLESSHAMPAGTIAALAIEIDGREYMDEVRVSRSQLLAGVGERYELGVEFLWLRLPREHSLRSYAATLTRQFDAAGDRRSFGGKGFQELYRVAACYGRRHQRPVRRHSERDRNGLCQGNQARHRPITKHW